MSSVIAKEYRAGVLENIHHGAVCIIDDDKRVIYEKGDINQPIFYRSAMKPIQAIPIFTTNIIADYHLTSDEAALFTASQRGETYHEQALENLAAKLGLSEESLVCSESYPLNEQPKLRYVRGGKPKRKLLHNCAGKHLGFLAYSREMGYDVSSYEQLSHPLQQEVLQLVSDLSETPIEQVVTGIDGCGVPVHGVPLKNMAISYLKFVAQELISIQETSEAVSKIGKIMNQHPEIVASHNFVCSALLNDPNIIAKGGAQGVYCLALKKEKVSISLKVLSGSELIWPLLIAEILKKINYQNNDTVERLLQLRSEDIVNDNGKLVGNTKIYL